MIRAPAKRLSLCYVEKRKSPRLSCSLPIEAQCRQKYGFNHIVDISLNGVGVLCDRPAAVSLRDKHVRLRFYLPGQAQFTERLACVIFIDGNYVGLHFLAAEKPMHELFKEFYLSVSRNTVLEEGCWARSAVPSPQSESAPASDKTSDKRASARKPLRQEFQIELTSKNRPGKVVGRVLDESRHGISFEFQLPQGVPLSFRAGSIFSDGIITGKTKTVKTGPAKVCHITPVRGTKGLIKVGLSIVPSKQIPVLNVVKANLFEIKPEPGNGVMKKEIPGVVIPIVVKYKNPQQEELVGLLNTTFGTKIDAPAPVVVIAPGFGQQKEAGALLAQILIQTFLHHKKELAVLRFDFTRSVGESHCDLAEEEKEGTEYLTFTFSQALQDLKATLAYAKKNSHFAASQVCVISSGFSSPVARRALLEEEAGKELHWFSFFGATDPQNWIQQNAARADYVGGFAQGRRSGIVSFLGSLFNADRVSDDLLKTGMAFFDDARREMAQLSAPVTWIAGSSDRTVPAELVRELMAVAAPARRKLIELATDHLSLSQVKATPTFYLLAEEIFESLHGKRVKACVPDPELFKKITQKEWSRVKNG